MYCDILIYHCIVPSLLGRFSSHVASELVRLKSTYVCSKPVNQNTLKYGHLHNPHLIMAPNGVLSGHLKNQDTFCWSQDVHNTQVPLHIVDTYIMIINFIKI